MESVAFEDKIRTNTIPEQVVGTLTHYSHCLSAVQGALLNEGTKDIFAPADTVGSLGIFRNKTAVLKLAACSATGTIIRHSGQFTTPDVRPIMPDLQTEVAGILVKQFTGIASTLALELAVAQDTKETTRSITPTTLSGVWEISSAARILKKEVVHCRSTAQSLLKHATGWAGKDLPLLLKKVRMARSRSSF
jgi:hypothetical protein